MKLKLFKVLSAVLLAAKIYGQTPQPITADITYSDGVTNFSAASGTYTIYPRSDGNASQLEKPIIIIEGIDFFEDTYEPYIYTSVNTYISRSLANTLRA